MKKSSTILIVILVILILGFFGWQFLAKKSLEGETCQKNEDCQEGLRCIKNICSSGRLSSPCQTKSDCLSGFCVNEKCTEGVVGSPCQTKEDCLVDFCVNQKCSEGKEGDSCLTFNDCKELLCINSVCSKLSEQPDKEIFKEYFSRFRLGTVTEWPKEGPPLFEAKDVFQLGEQFCTEAEVLKDVTAEAEIYDPYEEVVVVPRMSGGPSLKQGGNIGCTNLPSGLSAGKKYEYKVYINDTLVAILPFEVR